MSHRSIFARSISVSASIVILFASARVQAAFHLWNLHEIYTDSSGNLQFIELFDSSGGQNFVNGMQIQVSNIGNTQTHTFTIPGSTLSGNTFNHALLFATAGAQAAGAPAPDYIIPNNFLFTAGGTINFFGANSGPYSALPTDGANSRTWTGGNALNSPQNYLGQVGLITIPEPAFGALLLTGGLLLLRRK